MSRRHDIQDATGRLTYLAGRGTLEAWGNGIAAGGGAANGNPINGVTGFAPSCEWFNPLNGGVWINNGTFTNALWVRNDGSSSEQTQFGSALLSANFSTFSSEGNLYRNVGNPIKGNGADLTDDILDGFVLPANSFDVANRGLTFSFAGSLAATANNKRIKIWVNPTMAGQTVTNGVISGGTVSAVGTGVLLLDSGVQAGNNVGWYMMLNFFKYGIANSNTQMSSGAQFAFGTTHGGTTLPIAATQTENAAMNFVITGSSPTTGAANDVLLTWSEVNAMN